MPLMSISQTAPGDISCVEPGVPVKMQSPALRVTYLVMNSIMVGMSKIRSLVLWSCSTLPLTRVWSHWSAGLASVSIQGPIGEKVSADLARHPVGVVLVAVLALPVAGGNVVAAGVAEDMVEGVFLGDIAAVVLDDDDHLTLGIEPLDFLGPDDGVLGADNAGGCLVEDHRVLGCGAVADVAGVVQAHGEDLAWDDRGQQLDVGQLVDVIGDGEVPEGASVDGGDIVAVHHTVVDISVGFIPGDFHRFLLVLFCRLEGFARPEF